MAISAFTQCYKHGARWNRLELMTLARMIADNAPYAAMSEKLRRTEGAIKSMIDGKSGKTSFKLLSYELGQIVKGWIPADLKSSAKAEPKRPFGGNSPPGLASVDYVEDKHPLGAWPFTKPTVKPAVAPVLSKPLKHRSRWTSADDHTLKMLYSQHHNTSDMAKRLDRTVSGVLGRLSHLGFIYFDKDENAFFMKPVLYYRF